MSTTAVEWLNLVRLAGLILGGIGLAMILKGVLDNWVDRDVKKAVAEWPKPPPRIEPYPSFDAWRAEILNPEISIDAILERSALGVPKKPEPECVLKTSSRWEVTFYNADEPDKLRGAAPMVVDEVADFPDHNWERLTKDILHEGQAYQGTLADKRWFWDYFSPKR